jgi:hypothetical protein
MASGHDAGSAVPKGRSAWLAALVAATVLGSLAACQDGRDRPGPPAAPGAAPGATGLEQPGLTLTGEVTRTFGPHVVQVGTSPSRDPVLVVFARPTTLAPGTPIEATGRIRTFNRVEIESELTVRLGPDVDGLEGRSCLVAETLRLGPRTAPGG